MFNEFIINKTNLINNAKILKQKSSNALLCIMAKANAYGVGLKQVVKTLSSVADFFGVSNSLEAEQTSKYTNKKILIVGSIDKSIKVSNRFSYACHSVEDVDFLISKNKKINIHLKINTGMNRYGISSLKEFKTILNRVKHSKLNLEGLFTHFATADNFVVTQLKKFNIFKKVCKEYGFNPIIHTDNSSVFKKFNNKNAMIRIGFDMYNCSNNQFMPAVEIKSTIVQINKCKKSDLVGYNRNFVASKPMRVAVVPVGYADGFSSKYIGLTLNCCNSKCKVLNVCMDCFMIDITSTNIKKGDSVYLLNKQNPLSKYAKHSGLSEYEVMCNFSHIRASRSLVFS